MYFPTATAQSHVTRDPLGSQNAHTVDIARNESRSLFCVLTENAIAVWKVRPAVLLAYITRSKVSLESHGTNRNVLWSSDSQRLVVITNTSHIVLINVNTISSNNPPYGSSSTASSVQFGPGEGHQLPSISLRFEGVVQIDGGALCISPRESHIMFSTQHPPAIQTIPWPHLEAANPQPDSEKTWLGHDTTLMGQDLPWLIRTDVYVTSISHSRLGGVEVWVTSDGRAYFVHMEAPFVSSPIATSSDLASEEHEMEVISAREAASIDAIRKPSSDSVSERVILDKVRWIGTCIHGHDTEALSLPESDQATCAAINPQFSVIAIGTASGGLIIVPFPIPGVLPKHTQAQLRIPSLASTGALTCAEWTSDGYACAVGWERGWGAWSVGGRCLCWAVGMENVGAGIGMNESGKQDAFMFGISALFWNPGNTELWVLSTGRNHATKEPHSGSLFSIPFVKSAIAGQHSPDNTRYAFLQMDDRVLVYRGADQPDMSVINPESDVWQHICVPSAYLAYNWPIRSASIAPDGRLIAVAGRRGLVHYSSASGKWKRFADLKQEQSFAVKGGMIWFHHVLVVACVVGKSYQVRLFSRDLELTAQNILHREIFVAPVVCLSLVDSNSLLVYTSDNTLFHFLILPTRDSISLHLCGSISFDGIVTVPGIVRGLSWMIPNEHREMGDPVNDLTIATVLLLVGGRLVLLKPRKTGSEEVRYDMQILADRIEFCWIHLEGIGTLENSLWGYDGRGIRLWLDALTLEDPASNNPVDGAQSSESVQESVNIPLSFYPLSVLMDKGIIIGVEHEIATRGSLPFVMFRIVPTTHLFLHHVLEHHLTRGHVGDAVQFATHYQHLVFFAHAQEVLLHNVLESEWDRMNAQPSSDFTPTLPAVVEFLDYFDTSLEVVVGCARKTEMARWNYLFDTVGNPRDLFEACLSSNLLKVAASYLIVLHTLNELDQSHEDVIRLLEKAINEKEWSLCRDVLRFLQSADDTGLALRRAVAMSGLLPQTL
ncbi:Protein RIC1 homolog OS=Drosophila melanogaster GN=CG9063 PE=1 SV=1 [Rhizoctonia solani AG-1 IB]|uniref:Protein RIC1 homolog n=1 Tax=Thanatephorus cucumeris (strain AG1-IB / isolate 7/3/14) TaxID=1108050 RepID=A0A0B7F5U4_THACB|nr:Protein RIC1 homolog OS=Drosophila melanogaster GN=CG9063 PE=1 SV=1 [Rhizoctonia solani AG-1 IB]